MHQCCGISVGTGTRCLTTKRRLIDDTNHWRDRADEARAIAASLSDPESKRIMIAIAENYDRLAERAEESDKQE